MSPLTIGYAPKLGSPSRTVVPAAAASPSRAPSSMYERSAASSSSRRLPAKHEPGSTSAKTDRGGHVEPLQDAPPEEPDLPREPVGLAGRRAAGRRPSRGPRSPSCEAPRRRSPPRWSGGGGSRSSSSRASASGQKCGPLGVQTREVAGRRGRPAPSRRSRPRPGPIDDAGRGGGTRSGPRRSCGRAAAGRSPAPIAGRSLRSAELGARGRARPRPAGTVERPRRPGPTPPRAGP